jgi:hypothetical protein
MSIIEGLAARSDAASRWLLASKAPIAIAKLLLATDKAVQARAGQVLASLDKSNIVGLVLQTLASGWGQANSTMMQQLQRTKQENVAIKAALVEACTDIESVKLKLKRSNAVAAKKTAELRALREELSQSRSMLEFQTVEAETILESEIERVEMDHVRTISSLETHHQSELDRARSRTPPQIPRGSPGSVGGGSSFDGRDSRNYLNSSRRGSDAAANMYHSPGKGTSFVHPGFSSGVDSDGSETGSMRSYASSGSTMIGSSPPPQLVRRLPAPSPSRSAERRQLPSRPQAMLLRSPRATAEAGRPVAVLGMARQSPQKTGSRQSPQKSGSPPKQKFKHVEGFGLMPVARYVNV